MRLASRLRHSRLATVAGIAGAALLLAPPPAAADRDDWEDDGYSRSHRDHGHHHRGHRRGHHHRHGDWCPPKHARPHAYGYYDDAPRRHAHRARYECGPCGHSYHDERAFHRHVHHHHHVPLAVLPIVIAATVFGAVFTGY